MICIKNLKLLLSVSYFISNFLFFRNFSFLNLYQSLDYSGFVFDYYTQTYTFICVFKLIEVFIL